MAHFTSRQVEALLAKHHLPVVEPEKAEFEGVVNEVWFAGDVVVRINKDLDFESDVWTETVAVPALVEAGTLTPRLLAFDSDRDIVPRLVTIYERKPGRSICRTSQLDDPGQVYCSLGERVREFHDRVRVVNDPEGKLDPPWTPDYAAARANLVAMVPSSDAWLPHDLIFQPDEPPTFTHQDLHPDNILVHDGKLTAIIDWGDAGWGSRTSDLRYLPSRFMADFLEGYGEISEQDRINIMIHHVDQFVYVTKNERTYGVYGDTALEELKTLLGGEF